jgi:rod shape-determining protein MreD
MKPVAIPRAEPFPASLLPLVTMLALATVTVMPFRIPGYAAVTPAFALMGVYHWTVYRPALLPPLALFALGVFLDLLTGAPLGVSSIVFLLARAVVLRNRRFFVGKEFPFVWSGFTLLAAGAVAFTWALGSLYSRELFDARPFLLQWVLTVAIFPAADRFLVRLQRWFLP